MGDRTAVGEFVYLRAKNPNDTTLPWGIVGPSKAGLTPDRMQSGSTHTLVFQFRVYDFWLESEPTDPPFPVSLEIYDLNSKQMLLGTYRLLEAGVPTATAANMALGAPCLNWSSGDGSQQFWAVDLPDGDYRAILLPGANFWYPDDPDPGAFSIEGQLAVRDAVTVWSAPSSDHPDTPILFYGVNGPTGDSNLGFSAYRDYSILGGVIQGGPALVHIDADGDGYEDGTVTSVLQENPIDIGMSTPFAVHPNPFRESTTIRWSVRLGQPRYVDIYRVDGRRIRSATVQHNSQLFLWDGMSNSGQRQPSGIYVVRVRDVSGRVLGSQKLMRVR